MIRLVFRDGTGEWVELFRDDNSEGKVEFEFAVRLPSAGFFAVEVTSPVDVVPGETAFDLEWLGSTLTCTPTFLYGDCEMTLDTRTEDPACSAFQLWSEGTQIVEVEATTTSGLLTPRIAIQDRFGNLTALERNAAQSPEANLRAVLSHGSNTISVSGEDATKSGYFRFASTCSPCVPPTIQTQSSTSTPSGERRLSIIAVGVGELTYVWYEKVGSSMSPLAMPSAPELIVPISDRRTLLVQVTDGCGTTTSSEFVPLSRRRSVRHR